MSRTVLLVEDDRALRNSLREALSVEGYDLKTAASLADAGYGQRRSRICELNVAAAAIGCVERSNGIGATERRAANRRRLQRAGVDIKCSALQIGRAHV